MTTAQILATSPAPAHTGDAPVPPAYEIAIATTADEVRAAQRLRHQVFAGELGARLSGTESGLDVDEFDAICDHLIVRDNRGGEVVGTYRMLPPHRAGGTLYADSEFALTGLAPLRDVLVETGRSCVHPDHRGGAVINLMWAGIARYLHLHGYRWLVGCASVPLADGGANADSVWQVVREKYLSPPRLRVTPHRPYRFAPVNPGDRARLRSAVPPLLRGYLRLGAWVCGAPAHDPAFDVADFLVLLSLDRVDPRYLNHFLGEPSSVPALPRLA